MSRMGRPHRPFYRINAVDSRVKRDGSVIENLGWYDPTNTKSAKTLELNAERIKHWLSVGAQPSETVTDLLVKNKLIDGSKRKAEIADRIAAKKVAAEKAAAIAAAGGKKEEKKAE
jgi:small subunit ribosomal protein S16